MGDSGRLIPQLNFMTKDAAEIEICVPLRRSAVVATRSSQSDRSRITSSNMYNCRPVDYE